MWLGVTLKISSNTSKKKNTVKGFSSSLDVMVGYLCVQSLPESA